MASFQIEIYPQVLLANVLASVDIAVESARQLEKVGHSITSINRNGELYANGTTLRDLLGAKEVSTFRNFAVTSC
ncbi:hypothetical protein [Tardiphaga sp.]|uniref:hypothetical protein n=1 Tax=Tardiphaga sp. TaxID=1926292 RepID=UPI00352B56A8